MQLLPRRSIPLWRHGRHAAQGLVWRELTSSGLAPASAPGWHQSQLRSRLDQEVKRGGSSQIRGYQSQGWKDHPTIYALSTAAGTAAIAVVRVSGPACTEIYSALCAGRDLPKPRLATLRKLYEPRRAPSESTILDSGALVLYFPAPQTVTGEDVLELHIHGGIAVVKAVLAAIPKCIQIKSQDSRRHVVRYAEAGEFTRRAFLNDRLDLTQIEALGDTLSATTEQQRRLSVRGTTSALAKRYESWRQQLLHARGELEALIDFSEDQHFDESPATLASSVAVQVERLLLQINAHRENAVRGELLRNGISVSLLRAPNAGKSSLLNRVVGREAAIVSREEGTTRDIVEVGVDLGGWFCRLGDMAGLRVTEQGGAGEIDGSGPVGAVEREGISRAISRALTSDVLIVVLSIEPTASGDGTADLRLDSSVLATAKQYASTTKKGTVIVAVNKLDNLASNTLPREYIQNLTKAMPSLDPSHIFGISCKDAVSPSPLTDPVSDPGNIQAFLRGLIEAFEDMTAAVIPTDDMEPGPPNGSPAIPGDAMPADRSIYESSLGASERQRLLLEECATHLSAFLAGVRMAKHDDLHASGTEGTLRSGAVPKTASSPDEESRTETETTGSGEIDIVVLAEELRAAAGCLARMTGKGDMDAGDVEEVLGVVFEKFCVGK